MLPVFLMLVVTFIDLGVGVFRYNKVAQAAREAAREAAVRGSLSPPHHTPWGPNTLTVTGDDFKRTRETQIADVEIGDDLASTLQSHVSGLDPLTTTVDIEWLDGDNHWGSRVRVTVHSTYQPIMTSWISSQRISLQSSCTVRIEH